MTDDKVTEAESDAEDDADELKLGGGPFARNGDGGGMTFWEGRATHQGGAESRHEHRLAVGIHIGREYLPVGQHASRIKFLC